MGVDVAIFGDCQDVINIGDVVLIQPDEAGVANDVMNKYTLGINLGEVTKVVSKSTVEVSYLFATSLEGAWQCWIDRESGATFQRLLLVLTKTQGDNIR